MFAAYEIYYPDACDRAARMSQCSAAKTLTAEQACDCAAGYMYDVQTGVGAGEVVAGGNRSVAVKACQAGADAANGPIKAPYLAQMGRAEMYAPSGTFDGAKTLMQAIAAGYPRAEVDIARAHIRDVEFGGVAVDDLQVALSHLAKGRSAGARETATVVESAKQVAAVKKWNSDVTKVWVNLTSDSESGELRTC